jgi:multicomponent Na+:H+ antiporter subunit C
MSYLQANYAYIAIVLLLSLGFYGMIAKRDLLRKVIAMGIFQTATFLFFIHGGAKWGGTIPVLTEAGSDPTAYVNPLPHVLVLTAIVVGVATTGVALALLIRIRREYDTLDEDELLERLR